MRDKIETVEYQKTEAKIKLIKGQRDSYGFELTLPRAEGTTNEAWIAELMHLAETINEQIDTLTKLKEAKNDEW